MDGMEQPWVSLLEDIRMGCYVAFSADGSQLASGSTDGKVHLWEVANGARVYNALEGYTDWVSCVAFSADGALLASGSSDGTVRLWDTRRRAAVGDVLRWRHRGVRGVWFSADVSKIACRLDSEYWCVWSVPCGQLLWVSERSTNDGSNVLNDAEGQMLTQSVKMELASKATTKQRLRCDGITVLMKHNGSDNPLATLPQVAKLSLYVDNDFFACMCIQDRNEFVAVLQNGIIAVLRLNS